MKESCADRGDTATLSLTLQGRHLAYLERLAEQIRQTTGASLNPGDVVHSLVEALSEAAAVRPSAIRSAADLTELFYRRFTQQEDVRHDRDRMRP
ncbi:MAG: hypothetical protein AB1578_09645 [Thermodesulfobacteriota bacterium]|jgi:hypothetical protein